jgi:hypothetical protein
MIAGSVAALDATRGELRGVAPADVVPAQRTPVTPVPSSPRPLNVGVIDVTSFKGGDGVVVLGSENCGHGLCPGGPAALAKSRDGGKTFAAIPVPTGLRTDGSAATPGPVVHNVRFSGPLHGWLAGTELWVTHDGGATWGRLGVPSQRPGARPSWNIEVDGERAWAMREAREYVYELWSSPVRTDAWTRVATVDVSSAAPKPPSPPPTQDGRYFPPPRPESTFAGFAAGGGDAYLAIGDRLYRSDGQRFSTGCRTPNERAAVSVAVRAVWVACGSDGRPWHIRVSTDRGASFRPVADQLSHVEAFGGRTDKEAFVMDYGHTLWSVRTDSKTAIVAQRLSLTGPPGGGFIAFASTQVGYTVTYERGIWRTDDGGKTWRRLPVGGTNDRVE